MVRYGIAQHAAVHVWNRVTLLCSSSKKPFPRGMWRLCEPLMVVWSWSYKSCDPITCRTLFLWVRRRSTKTFQDPSLYWSPTNPHSRHSAVLVDSKKFMMKMNPSSSSTTIPDTLRWVNSVIFLWFSESPQPPLSRDFCLPESKSAKFSASDGHPRAMGPADMNDQSVPLWFTGLRDHLLKWLVIWVTRLRGLCGSFPNSWEYIKKNGKMLGKKLIE